MTRPSNSPQRKSLEGPRQERVSRKGKPSQHASLFLERVIVQKKMPVSVGIRSVFHFLEGTANIGVSVSKHTEQVGSEPQKRHVSVVVAKNIG